MASQSQGALRFLKAAVVILALLIVAAWAAKIYETNRRAANKDKEFEVLMAAVWSMKDDDKARAYVQSHLQVVLDATHSPNSMRKRRAMEILGVFHPPGT